MKIAKLRPVLAADPGSIPPKEKITAFDKHDPVHRHYKSVRRMGQDIMASLAAIKKGERTPER